MNLGLLSTAQRLDIIKEKEERKDPRNLSDQELAREIESFEERLGELRMLRVERRARDAPPRAPIHCPTCKKELRDLYGAHGDKYLLENHYYNSWTCRPLIPEQARA